MSRERAELELRHAELKEVARWANELGLKGRKIVETWVSENEEEGTRRMMLVLETHSSVSPQKSLD